MTSLPKTMAKFGPPGNQKNMYTIRKVLIRTIQKCALNLSHCVKSYGHFCQILALFTMPAHQIWSCHVTQDANFEIFYYLLILHLILRKVTKFLVEKLSTSEVISKKPHGGTVENTPPPRSAFKVKGSFPLGGIFRAKRYISLSFDAHAPLIGL